MRPLYFLFSMLFILSPGPLQATVFTPIADADLLARADTVVVGTVLEVADDLQQRRPEVRYRVRVDELFKGETAGAVTVAIPGGRDARGRLFSVEGAPMFAVGERVLLFLTQRSDGALQLTQLFLGAFHLSQQNGTTIARRSLGGAVELPPQNDRQAEAKLLASGRVRDAEKFMQWLRASNAGQGNSAAAQAYWLELSTALEDTFAKFATTASRWRSFDLNIPVLWWVHKNIESVMVGGGYYQILQALACWTDDDGSDIAYHYAGARTSPEAAEADDINLILFEDPNNEIDGSYDCFQGGILGVGGYWSEGSHIYQGLRMNTIVEGDIVFQDGAGCYFNLYNGSNGAEVFAHELGHTLGLGHSSDTDALMFSIAHGGGRGATLSDDDRYAIDYLYGSGLPQAPAGLTASDGSFSDRVTVVWQDVGGADSYALYRSETAAATGAVIYSGTAASAEDLSAVPGILYYYRVRACNATGCSAMSSADTGYAMPPVPAPPTGLAASDGLFAERIRIRWNASAGATAYRLFASEEAGLLGTMVYDGAGLEFDDFNYISSRTYYRVQACNLAGCSALSEAEAGWVFIPGTAFPGILLLLR